MSRRAQENIVACIMLGIFLAMLIATLGYSSRARLVPLPIAILGVVFAVAQLLWQNLRSRDELRVNILDFLGSRGGTGAAAMPPQIASDPVQEAGSTGAAPTGRSGGELSAFGVVALLLALVFVVGPLPAIFVFTFGYLALTRHCSALRAFLYALASVVVIYGLFGFTLGIQFNRGMIAGLLGEYVEF